MLAVRTRRGLHGLKWGHSMLTMLCWDVHSNRGKSDMCQLPHRNILIHNKSLRPEPLQRMSIWKVLPDSRDDVSIGMPEMSRWDQQHAGGHGLHWMSSWDFPG